MKQHFAVNLARAMGRMPASRLAREIGVHPSAVCQWLKARTVPNLERAAQVARHLGVSLDALLQEQP